MINLRIVIISVLFLIGLFSGIASYLIILGLSFIGLSYIIVYVGAVSILFLFILMLINIRISELQNNTNNSILLSIIVGIYLHFILFILLPYEITILKNNSNYSLLNLLINYYLIYIGGNFSTYYGWYTSILSGSIDIVNNIISFVSSVAWDANIATKGNNQINIIGSLMYTYYNLWLILTSLILLLAMTGTITIVTTTTPAKKVV